MDASNIILNLPFDESAGSLIAYDYSKNRADGEVTGATFVRGINGNAIKFAGGDETCEVDKNVLGLSSEFSIIAFVNALTIEVGSPKKIIWMLAFAGVDNYVDVSTDLNSGTWISVCITRKESEFNFYVNGKLIQTISKSDTLVGLSLNQDYYGSDLGLGMLDDVKIYNVALTPDELLSELTFKKQPAYLLDGVDFKEYGVFVSASEGIVSRPKSKEFAKTSWDDYHGESVDLQHKYYEPREIVLSCFIKATSKKDFIIKASQFEQLFDKAGTSRLMIDVHPTKPLIYEVYCKDEVEIAKTWNDEVMVGTFKLKLIEPEPVKRVLKHIRESELTKTCTITLTTAKLVNVFWGDGTVTYDASGTDLELTHDYTKNGEYYPVITGCIDEISAFTTNAIVVWNKL